MAKYAFLTDEWMEAAKAVRDEYADQVSPPAHAKGAALPGAPAAMAVGWSVP